MLNKSIIMQKYLLISFFIFSFLILILPVNAQNLNNYAIEADIQKSGITNVKLVLIFSEPIKYFESVLPIKVSDLNITSNAGQVLCNNKLSEITLISCEIPLNENKKTLTIKYNSLEYVKNTHNGFAFSGDFNIKIPSENVLVAIRLPEGMVLNNDIPGGSTIPFTNSTSTDGRKITFIWRIQNFDDNLLNFQIFYESGIKIDSGILTNPIYVTSIFVLIVLTGLGAIILIKTLNQKRTVRLEKENEKLKILEKKAVEEKKEAEEENKKKEQELEKKYYYINKLKEKVKKIKKTKINYKESLSILDDYERNILSTIQESNEGINQQEIAKKTNISKAKVSKVVKKLQEMKFISVERHGRTNIVKFLDKNM